MRILYLTHYDRLYGANRALLELVLRIQAEGKHQPLVVVPAEGELTDRLRGAGVTVLVRPITQWQAIYVEAISFARKKKKRTAQLEAETEALAGELKDAGIDLIHSNSSVIGTGALLSRRLGCKHIWHVREYAREHYGMEYFYPEDTVRAYYEEADCIVAISDALRDDLRRKYPAAQILRIYDGIPVEAETLPRQPGEGVLRFLYTGYLFPAKRQLDVLRAARVLLAEGITGFHITFAGDGDPAYFRRLARQSAAKGLREHITLAGYVTDMDALLAGSDIGIIASDHEGFGLATAEYMRWGLPVIGRRSGATPELVADGESGILYDDVAGLAEAMRRLIEDGALRERMGAAGAERVRRSFTLEQNVRALSALYDKLEQGSL